MTGDLADALRWIDSILDGLGITYQVAGGLAAVSYGSNGWTIEAAAASTARVWDRRTGAWAPAGIRFDQSDEREVCGVVMPVMPWRQLLDYKTGLGREVDLLDVAELRALRGRVRAEGEQDR